MPVPTLARRAITLVLAILISAGLGAAICAIGIEAFDQRPAVIIKTAVDANTITYRDGRLQIYFEVDKRRDCATTTSRWLWTWVDYKGEQVRLFMPLGVSLAGVTSIGQEQHYLLSLALPRGVWDGTWYYYARSVPECGGLLGLIRRNIEETDSIPIIVKGTEGTPPRGIEQTKHPKNDPSIPIWTKAIVMDGRPLN